MMRSAKSIIKKILFGLRILDEAEHVAKRTKRQEEHPERLAILPYCTEGRGVDVGCGNRKTSENCIGVDIVPSGKLGRVGSVTGKVSEADICTSGDDLSMFEDGELDFVVARHNLEHYHDVIKTLREWTRVLKKGGTMALIVPDELGLNAVGRHTMELDPTHYHVFTQESIRNILDLFDGLQVVKCETVIENWSFICVCKKL